MTNVLEIKLSISDTGNTLETITMPKNIYDIHKCFGEYRLKEKDVYGEYINSRNIFLNRNGYKDSCIAIPNIEDVKESFRLLAKAYNITVKLWINDELQITKGKYWQCLGNIKSVGLSTSCVEIDSAINYNYLIGTTSAIIDGYEVNALKTNNEEECNMKGIEAKIVAKVAVINTQTDRVNTEIVYGSNITRIAEEERNAIVDGENVRDIYSLVIDETEIINLPKPKLEVTDNREEYCKLKSDFAYEDYLWRLGLQTKEECDVKKAEIELKLSKISDKVEYRLIWE